MVIHNIFKSLLTVQGTNKCYYFMEMNTPPLKGHKSRLEIHIPRATREFRGINKYNLNCLYSIGDDKKIDVRKA